MVGDPSAKLTPEQLKWASNFTGLDAATADRVGTMDRDYHAAVDGGDWARAATDVYGYASADLQKHLKLLSPDQIVKLHQAALDCGLGPDSAAAKATASGMAGKSAEPPGSPKKAAAKPDPAPVDPRVAKLTADYEAAIQAKDWNTAAELLNAFSRDDIKAKLAKRSAAEIIELNTAARANPKVGPDANVTLLTSAGSPNAQVADGIGVDAKIRAISGSVILAANQVVYHEGENTLKVADATMVKVTASPSGLAIEFYPPLLIVHTQYHIDWNIKLTSGRTDFAGKSIYFDWDASKVATKWGGIDKTLEALVRDNLLKNLPARMAAPGYDIYADPKIETDLANLAKSLFPKTSGGAAPATPKMSNTMLHADITVTGQLRSGPVSAPAGMAVELDVSLAGDTPESLADAKIGSASMKFGGSGVTFNVTILKTDLPVIFVERVTLSSGGHLRLDYTIMTEALEAGLKLILVQLAASQGQPIGDNALDPRQPNLHKVIDDLVHTKVEPMLRDIIVQNKSAIPGMDLVKALGL